MPRLLPLTVALRTLKKQHLPPRCKITDEQAVDWLRKLTGQDFGTDATAWSNWLRENRSRIRKPAADSQEVMGEVIELSPNLECRIRLDSGTEIRAQIRRQVARRMFRVVPGDRVRVRLLEPSCSEVTGFAP